MNSATPELYTLSLTTLFRSVRDHERDRPGRIVLRLRAGGRESDHERSQPSPCAGDRKSTRLNSSHLGISYAVFCLKKKSWTTHETPPRCVLSSLTRSSQPGT